MRFYVYGHYNEKGDLKYIGKGCKARARTSDGRSQLWKNTFPNGPAKVALLHSNLTEEDAFRLEREEIDKAYSTGINLINLLRENPGGATWLFTDDTRKYFSEIRTGEKHWTYGKVRSEETRAKISATKLANPQEPYWLGKKRDPELMARLIKAAHTPEARAKQAEAMRGRTLSEEHKAKIGAASKEVMRTPEWNKAISEAKRGRSNGLEGRKLSDEVRKRMSDARKSSEKAKQASAKVWETRRMNGTASGFTTAKARAVRCKETGQVYRSAKDAAQEIEGSDKHIQACCVGRRMTHKKLSWEYA